MTDGSFRDQVHGEMMRRLNQQAEEFDVNADHGYRTPPPRDWMERSASAGSMLDAETLMLGGQSDDHHEEEAGESEEVENDELVGPAPEQKSRPREIKLDPVIESTAEQSKPDPEIKSTAEAEQSKPDPEIKSTAEAEQSKPDPEIKSTAEAEQSKPDSDVTPWVDRSETFQASEEEPSPMREHEAHETGKKPAASLQAAAKGKAAAKAKAKAKAKSVFKRPASGAASKADGSKPLKRPAASPSTASTPMKRPAGAGTGAESETIAESVAIDPKEIDMSKWTWTDSDDSGRESIHGDWKAWAFSVHQSFNC